MKKSTKAVLLSALVFPGTGHFLLKKYIPGVIIAGTAIFGLYVLIAGAVEKALQIAEKIQSGEVQPDVAAIAELVSKQPAGADAQLINIATAALVIAWLLGIIDSYRLGRLQDQDASLN